MKTRADAVITVHQYQPAAYDEPAEGPVLDRIHIEESFSGDMTGDGAAEFLQAGHADGSASWPGCVAPVVSARTSARAPRSTSITG